MYLRCACFHCCVYFTVYWIAGAQICFLATSASFIIPLTLLRTARRLKEEWAVLRLLTAFKKDWLQMHSDILVLTWMYVLGKQPLNDSCFSCATIMKRCVYVYFLCCWPRNKTKEGLSEWLYECEINNTMPFFLTCAHYGQHGSELVKKKYLCACWTYLTWRLCRVTDMVGNI